MAPRLGYCFCKLCFKVSEFRIKIDVSHHARIFISLCQKIHVVNTGVSYFDTC